MKHRTHLNINLYPFFPRHKYQETQDTTGAGETELLLFRHKYIYMTTQNTDLKLDFNVSASHFLSLHSFLHRFFKTYFNSAYFFHYILFFCFTYNLILFLLHFSLWESLSFTNSLIPHDSFVFSLSQGIPVFRVSDRSITSILIWT